MDSKRAENHTMIELWKRAAEGVRMMYEPTLDPVVVGEVIASFRHNRRMSQEVLSGLSAIGRTHLSAIERGLRKPTLETLYRISQALGVRMSDMVREMEKRLEKKKKK